MSDPPRGPRSFAAKLPAGRHRLSREQVLESQRWRLLRAAAEVLFACDYGGTNSRRICDRAGVSSSTFYLHFEDADACLTAAHAMTADCIWELVSAACTGAGGWPRRLRASLDAISGFLLAEPSLARLLGADLAAGVPAVAAARARLLARLAGLLCSGRAQQLERAERLGPKFEVHLVDGIALLIAGTILAGELDRLPALSLELAELLSAPYLSASGN